MTKKIKAVKDEVLSEPFFPRYIIIDVETDQVLDNAQGYGYKSKEKAYAAWSYLHGDKEKRKKKRQKIKNIQKWLETYPNFIEAMLTYDFEIAKGSHGKDAIFDINFVELLMKEYNIENRYSAKEIMSAYKEINPEKYI